MYYNLYIVKSIVKIEHRIFKIKNQLYYNNETTKLHVPHSQTRSFMGISASLQASRSVVIGQLL